MALLARTEAKVLYNELISENRKLKIIKRDEKIMCYVQPVTGEIKTYGIFMEWNEFEQFLDFVENVYEKNILYENNLMVKNGFVMVVTSMEYLLEYVIDVRVKYFCKRPEVMKFLPTKHGFRLYKKDIEELLLKKTFMKSIVKGDDITGEVVKDTNNILVNDENNTPKEIDITPVEEEVKNKLKRKPKRKCTNLSLKSKKKINFTTMDHDTQVFPSFTKDSPDEDTQVFMPYTQEMPIIEFSTDEEI